MHIAFIIMSLVHLFQANLVRGFRPNFAATALRVKSRSVARCFSSAEVPADFVKQKVYLNVPFEDKDEVKKLGAKWDQDTKKWYVGEFAPVKDFQKWQSPQDRQYLKVPFENKDEAKALGAWYDSDKKQWFVPSGASVAPFEKWLDSSSSASPPAVNQTYIDQLHAQESATELLFLKIDTTGFPTKAKFGYPPYDSVQDYNDARVVQVNALLCDRATFKPLDTISLIVRADDFTITNDKFHGISQDRSMHEGVEFGEVAHAVATMLESRPLILAHNAEFDLNILRSEMVRHGLLEALEVVNDTPALCTMQLTKSVLGLKDMNGNLKNPSFKELYGYAMIAESALEQGTRLGVKHLQEAVQKLVVNEELTL